MTKIYVGCSLTQAPPEFVEGITHLKAQLKTSYEILEFIGLVGGTPRDVFENDTAMVHTCDLFLADCTYPAIGLGYELGLALSLNKPILAIAKEGSKVSRLVLGVTNPNYSFEWYRAYSHIADLVKRKLEFPS